MKKRLFIGAAALAVYALLLFLLVLFESAAPESGIRSFGDALWFSLVTMTTVGFGDMYPVTPAGRAVGFVFLMVSTGLLAAALSFAAALLLGQMFPKLRLWLRRRRPLYVFGSACEEALILARGLISQERGAVCVFLTDGDVSPSQSSGRFIFLRGSLDEALRSARDVRGVFFLGTDGFYNLSRADSLKERYLPIYCESAIGRDSALDLTVFDRSELTARLYWQQHPLRRDAGAVVIIGSGLYACRLLEQALLVNVFEQPQSLEYHVLGDGGEFMRQHTCLSQFLSVNAPDSARDSLFFHDGPWNADGRLLREAERIIICTDDDRRNMEILETLDRRYPRAGQIHIRLLNPLSGVDELAAVFGGCRELFTPELVLRKTLNALAVKMNELYRSRAGSSAPAWDGLSPFARRSCMAAADHLLTKLRILLPDEDIRSVTAESCARAYRAYKASLPEKAEAYRAAEHERWERFHYLDNWTYAASRDDSRRLHPLLRPYGELSPEEQRKDDDPWELLDAFS